MSTLLLSVVLYFPLVGDLLPENIRLLFFLFSVEDKDDSEPAMLAWVKSRNYKGKTTSLSHPVEKKTLTGLFDLVWPIGFVVVLVAYAGNFQKGEGTKLNNQFHSLIAFFTGLYADKEKVSQNPFTLPSDIDIFKRRAAETLVEKQVGYFHFFSVCTH